MSASPDHTVLVDRGTSPAGLDFAARFNVAVPFIDRHLVEGRAEKPAIRSAAGDVTYRALAERVNRCGLALQAAGLAPGERLLMVVKDAPEFFYLFWGAIKAGIVPVPLNTLLRADDYRYMIEDSGCAALVYSPEHESEVEAALASAAVRIVLRTVGPDSLETRMTTGMGALAPAPATAEDECFWLYSSGSTGRPKGVVHRHRDMVATSELYGVGTLGLHEGDVCYSAAKLFFAYGLGNAMTFPLWVGGTSVLNAARPTPQATFETIERFRPTLYFGVPTLYAAQLQAMEERRPDLSSLRLCVSAGEALPADILRRWCEATGKAILDGIGSTEALHIFISNRPDDVRPGASGRPVPGYRARIVGESGEALTAPGAVGRLWVAGLSTATHYWNDPERTRRAMVDGWLDTGDTYYRDAEGYYVYCGRNDDMMKVGGIWCSPVEIEAKLIEHPLVLEAAVVGRPDEEGLVKPEAFIVTKHPADAGPALADALVQSCRSGLAPYKYPRWVNFVPELPKTATGKIQRFKLRSPGVMPDKLIPLELAVRDLVPDGASVVLGACLEPMIPFAFTREIIRQNKRDLDVIAPISDASTDMLVGAGCVARVTGAWVGNVSGGLGHNYRRAVEQGVPRRITISDHSNFSLGMALLAGAYGMPYVPLRSLLGSDILKSNPAFRLQENPLAPGEPVVLVPPLTPDVALLAVQRADRFGNSHYWGSTGVSQEAAMASSCVILLADEIVAPEVIASDPNRVLYPGFRVAAVVEARAGVHPSPMTGVWQRDTAFFDDYHRRSRDREGFLGWLDEWVYGPADHAAYLARLGDRLERLRITGSAPAAAANFAAM